MIMRNEKKQNLKSDAQNLHKYSTFPVSFLFRLKLTRVCLGAMPEISQSPNDFKLPVT